MKSMISMLSDGQSAILKGDVYAYDFQCDEWRIVCSANDIRITDHRKFDFTDWHTRSIIRAETLFQNGWNQEKIRPHVC